MGYGYWSSRHEIVRPGRSVCGVFGLKELERPHLPLGEPRQHLLRQGQTIHRSDVVWNSSVRRIVINSGQRMATPSQTVIPSIPWKRIAIISFFGGLGFALGVGLILGCVHWYHKRPMPWKSETIKAHFVRAMWYPVYIPPPPNGSIEIRNPKQAEIPMGPVGRFQRIVGNMKVQLVFDLENTAAYDYTLRPPGIYGPIAMEQVKSSRSLARNNLMTWSQEWGGNYGAYSPDDSILIPAHQTVRVRFANEYEFLENPDSQQDWKNGEVQKQYVKEMLKNVDSFIILDEASHYRIELPLRDAMMN